MAKWEATFADGTKARLYVAAPGWQWIYGGLIYNQVIGTVKTWRTVRKKVRAWYAPWIFVEADVDEPVEVARISIHAYAVERKTGKLKDMDGRAATDSAELSW